MGIRFRSCPAIYRGVFDPGNKDSFHPDSKAVDELYQRVSQYIRYIKPKVLRSYNCIYTATPDWNFILDFAPGSERIIIGSACSSHGFKYAAATGEVLAGLATGGDINYDISAFRIGRFQ